MELRRSPTKSLETTSSSVYPRMPFITPSDAAFIAALISPRLVVLRVLNVRSTAETSAVGTRNAMPVSLPLSSGMQRVTAFAAPVEAGMMFMYASRPPRQSFLEGPSCVGWVAVAAWTVVIRPSSRPKPSLITLAMGARQLVVQEAFEMTVCLAGSYFSTFTPRQNVGTCSADLVGAEITTRRAPAAICRFAFSKSVKRPVLSRTYGTPRSFHGSLAGSFSAMVRVVLPATVKEDSVAATSAFLPPMRRRPCMVSYLRGD